MDKVALSFSTNAKLEKLIGRELITNNIIAIFELIKNSYDAFAHNAIVSFEGFDISSKDLGKVRHSERVISNVDSRIIIKDDGVGMSFEEVKTKWMEIGTTSKENTYIEKSLYSSEDKRVINGEKGIGRFGADKLGSLLRLISVGADGYEKTTLEIDWNKFDDHEKKIQDIDFDCYVERCTTPQKTGLTLEISLLRDKWTIADIVKLKNHLKKLISPFAQEQERFQIYLEYSKNDIERIVNDSFEYATTGIIANIDQYGLMKYEIYTALESECKEIKLVPPGFGPLKLQILYMDKAAKNAFTRRTGTTTKDYGNIKVFRDDFRVLPYGEKENDWLGIEFEFTVDNYYRIFVNVEELRISLENLLDNAVKAMQKEENKKVLIYITKQSKSINLYFEDNGTGVSKELAPFIFNVSFTTTNGSGIGLPNVLDFMKDEGGDINLLEQGKLKGAAFEMVFPIKGGVM